MHIAFFTNMYRPMVSGVVRSVNLFRQAFTNMGHNVFIFAQHAEDYEDTEPFVFRYPAINISWPADFPAILPVSPFIDQLLPRIKLDVIHAHHPILLGSAAAKKASDLDIPLVFTFHTNYKEYSAYIPLPQESIQDFIKEVIDTWIAEFMTKCHYIVIPSESMRSELEAEFGLRDSIRVIPTGIDLEPYEIADGQAMRDRYGWGDDPLLVSVGRLAREKNWSLVLQATAEAMQAIPRLRLAIAGDGPDRESLEHFSGLLGIRERVTFTGQLSFHDIPAFLKAGDAFIFASRSETQGLVTLEALAAGLPVVAVDATGTRDVVEDGVQGYLTPNDADRLGETAIRVLETPGELQRLRDAALQRARHFDINGQAQALLEVYHLAKEKQLAGETVRVPKKRSLFPLSD